MNSNTRQRNDLGFSFVQLIVTMVISGILLGTVGFAAFSYIGQARDTVLESNIRTAAEAVQNTLALNPSLRPFDNTATSTANPDSGAPSPELISELSNAAGFTWTPATATATDPGWLLAATDTDEIVHIQMIRKYTTAPALGATATAAAGGGSAADESPEVRWLVGQRDAVRIQIRNEEGSWACALIVLRPDWNSTMAGTGTPQAADIATVEGNLRGIWYDAGSNIPTDNGLHHCSPVIDDSDDVSGANYGNTDAQDQFAADANDALPEDGSEWAIPADGTTVPARTFLRSVPDFDAS